MTSQVIVTLQGHNKVICVTQEKFSSHEKETGYFILMWRYGKLQPGVIQCTDSHCQDIHINDDEHLTS